MHKHNYQIWTTALIGLKTPWLQPRSGVEYPVFSVFHFRIELGNKCWYEQSILTDSTKELALR